MRIEHKTCMRFNSRVIWAGLLVFGASVASNDRNPPEYVDHVDGCYVEMCGPDARQEDLLRELARDLVDEFRESPETDDDEPRSTDP